MRGKKRGKSEGKKTENKFSPAQLKIRKHSLTFDKWFQHFKLNTLDGWLDLPENKLKKINEWKLFWKWSEGDYKFILLTVYPSFPWAFSSPNSTLRRYLANKEEDKLREYITHSVPHQRELLHILCKKLNLRTVLLLKRNRALFTKAGGRLLLQLYRNNIDSLLSSLLHQPPKNEGKLSKQQGKMAAQRALLERCFSRLSLAYMQHWLTVPKKRLKSQPAEWKLLKKPFNLHWLPFLQSLYPFFPWSPSHDNDNDNDNDDDRTHHPPKIKRNKYEGMMEMIFHSFAFRSLDEWVDVSERKLRSMAKGIFRKYAQFNDILSGIYPHYPWDFLSPNYLIRRVIANKNERALVAYFTTSLVYQREYMQLLARRLGVKALTDWPKFKRKLLALSPPLLRFYSFDFPHLLHTLYPSHFPLHPPPTTSSIPTISEVVQLIKSNEKGSNKYPVLRKYFKSAGRQGEFMDYLFFSLRLPSLDHWLDVSDKQIKRHCGKYLLKRWPFPSLLLRVYPNYPWSFDQPLTVIRRMRANKHYAALADYLPQSLDYQRHFLSLLALQLNVNDPKGWAMNFSLLRRYCKPLLPLYSHSPRLLLTTLYPSFPWRFQYEEEDDRHALSVQEKTRVVVDLTLHHFAMKSLDEWIDMTYRKLKALPGCLFLRHHFTRNWPRFLTLIFPHYPWAFHSLPSLLRRLKAKKAKKSLRELLLQSIDVQREYMLLLQRQFNLPSPSYWPKRKTRMKKWAGEVIMSLYFGNFPNLLSTLYPHHSFSFSNPNPSKRSFKHTANQHAYFEGLFYQWKLQRLDQWLDIPEKKFAQLPKWPLIRKYVRRHSSWLAYLSSLYPHFPWLPSSPSSLLRLLLANKNYERIGQLLKQSLANQLEYMSLLFLRYNLSSLDDWPAHRSKFINGEGKVMMKLYSFDFLFLLTSLYPHHPYAGSRSLTIAKINQFRERYCIRQPRDWYRLALYSDRTFLYSLLHAIYPDHGWEETQFQSRSKKAKQRLLFSSTLKLFPFSHVFEDYYHPLLRHQSDTRYEYDIFIAEMDVGLEYQGEHHFDDIPSGFAGVELYRSRDQLKENFSLQLGLSVLYIPYWWDLHLSSLASSFKSFLSSVGKPAPLSWSALPLSPFTPPNTPFPFPYSPL